MVSRFLQTIRACLTLWTLTGLCAAPAAEAQMSQPVSGARDVLRLEGTDALSGIHYVRLTISQGAAADGGSAPPHFTMECTELGGKRDLNWFVAFGGVAPAGFLLAFHPTPEHPNRPPSEKLTMDFEGYTKWKPVTRAWELDTSGELRYRNPGLHSPNLDTPRSFLVYLNSLPALRIGFSDARAGAAVFQARPLLDELAKTPICQP